MKPIPVTLHGHTVGQVLSVRRLEGHVEATAVIDDDAPGGPVLRRYDLELSFCDPVVPDGVDAWQHTGPKRPELPACASPRPRSPWTR